MGNIPYYLSMPHSHTWYVYLRDEHHEYEDAPVGIWHHISTEEAVRNFMAKIDAFKLSPARVLYLYKGIRRKARVSKQDGKLIIRSDLLEYIITHIKSYERMELNTISVV